MQKHYRLIPELQNNRIGYCQEPIGFLGSFECGILEFHCKCYDQMNLKFYEKFEN